jgi:hypothetical protein
MGASPSDALVAARTLVALYPLDEWGHARVAQALTRCGRRLEARAYMSTARKALSSDGCRCRSRPRTTLCR